MDVTMELLNFRDALVAVVPKADRVGLEWHHLKAYDEWDAIADALYGGLVVDPIKWKLTEHQRLSLELPPYDLLLQEYSGCTTIRVRHPSVPGPDLHFHAFRTQREPFDCMSLLRLSEQGICLGEVPELCPCQDAIFELASVA